MDPNADNEDRQNIMQLVGSTASFDINLQGASDGKVVTRFPPEPSGYLHIGHAKAALLNDFFARKYHGKLTLRFDDTNTDKATQNFEDNIMKDLTDMGIRPDRVEYTSDYFEKLQEMAEGFIREGKAYVDGTPREEMKAQRFKKEENKYRGQSIDENLELWGEMLKGSERGMLHCLRAKISMSSKNGAMRDPIMYRCKESEHHRTGGRYKAYPTYDFSCPIVDSLSGVTHALRTTEYNDRNPQYYWFAEAASLRAPKVWGFSRLNFVNTELSKRKLQRIVDLGLVTGWDDPRFPTIQGVRRRGLTIKGLRAFILSQGPSKNLTVQQWDKIWTTNKRAIDPVAPRHTAIGSEGVYKAALYTMPSSPAENAEPVPYSEEQRFVPKHKKNEAVGQKVLLCGSQILLEKADAEGLQAGEKVTLMDLGNARVDSAMPDVKLCYLPDDHDFKKTKKLTWLAKVPDLVPVDLVSYGNLLKADAPDSDENAKDVSVEERVNRDSEKVESAVADVNTRLLQKGDIIQFERRGYYIVDRVAISASKRMKVIEIPDGRTEQKAHAKANSKANGATDVGKTGPSKKELKALKKKEKEERKAKRRQAKAEAAAAGAGTDTAELSKSTEATTGEEKSSS